MCVAGRDLKTGPEDLTWLYADGPYLRMFPVVPATAGGGGVGRQC